MAGTLFWQVLPWFRMVFYLKKDIYVVVTTYRARREDMRYDYDSETDILKITLSDEIPDHGEQAGEIITHYSKDGKPVEIEILDASDTALEMVKPVLEAKGKAVV